MNKANQVLLILIVFVLLGCSNGLTSKPEQSIYLFKDKDGLYQYDPITEKEIVIFDATEKQVFLDENYQLVNDILTFGFKGERTYSDSTNYSKSETVLNSYYSVDIKTGESWLSRKVTYEVTNHSLLNIKELLVDKDGSTVIQLDTSMTYKGSSSTSKRVTHNNFKPRFYSSHSLNDKSVFSLRGNIYFTDKLDTTLLVEYKGKFDSKFGSGYFQPQLDPSGAYVIFRYLPGFLNLKEQSSLQRISIEAKEIKKLKTGQYVNPIFSADGKFVLFKREQKQGKLNTWISEIYLLELTTMKEQKISRAYSAQWKQ